MSFEVRHFLGAAEPGNTAACQRLRYEVYHEELGLDPGGLDHTRRLDVQHYDDRARQFVVRKGDVVGCVRVLTGPADSFSAAEEFQFGHPFWRDAHVAEGSRYAVKAAYRDGAASLLLFGSVRKWCLTKGADRLLSVVMVPDPEGDPQVAGRALAWLSPRVDFETDLLVAHSGAYRSVASSSDGLEVPPMLKMLATRRSVLCGWPAYCDQYRAWSLPFVTRLSRGAE